MSHSVPNDENEALPSALVSDCLHSQSTTKIIPFSTPEDSQGVEKSSSLYWMHQKIIVEWKKKLKPRKNKSAKRLVKEMSMENLMAKDENGDTPLTRLLSDPEEFVKKKEHLIPLVKKLKTVPGALEVENNNRQSAVYLAAMNFPNMPHVFGYLAGEMRLQGIDINKVIDRSGNTLLHRIATKGDEYSDVLTKMLDILLTDSSYISCRNYNDESPLHLAIKHHHSCPLGAVVTIQLLLDNGAELGERMKLTGDTALHLALSTQCDVHLFKILLLNTDLETVNKKNFMGNTPLHLAALLFRNEDVEVQVKICKLLINAGALTHLENAMGEKPIDLVLQERKEILEKILDTE